VQGKGGATGLAAGHRLRDIATAGGGGATYAGVTREQGAPEVWVHDAVRERQQRAAPPARIALLVTACVVCAAGRAAALAGSTEPESSAEYHVRGDQRPRCRSAICPPGQVQGHYSLRTKPTKPMSALTIWSAHGLALDVQFGERGAGTAAGFD